MRLRPVSNPRSTRDGVPLAYGKEISARLLRRAANENIPTRRVSEGPTGNTLRSLAYASGWDGYVLICRTPKRLMRAASEDELTEVFIIAQCVETLFDVRLVDFDSAHRHFRCLEA